MRVLNTRTLNLQYFETRPENYAILSHTWGENELEFNEYRESTTLSRQSCRYEKIHHLCRQAVKDGINYAWIDTVCIDKSSSAELSEAINSMFSWYCNATVCYAYLPDVDEIGDIKSSRWIRRGWTLQELIAPEIVHFYGYGWQYLGSKSTMAEDLSSWTKIDSLVLRARETLEEFSIATRMQWASNRETTRREDMAYSLMGIFNVNMPLMYGEGHHAFVRLQEEILKRTQDDSILAWTDDTSQGNYLPSEISSFASSRKVVCTNARHHSFEFTERGLRMDVPILIEMVTERSYRHRSLCLQYCECQSGRQERQESLRALHWAVLNCRFERSFEGYVAIEVAEQNDGWYRVDTLRSVRIVPQEALENTVRRVVTLRSNRRASLFPDLTRTSNITTRSVCLVEADELIRHDFKISHFSHDPSNRCWKANTMVSEILSAERVGAFVIRYFVLFHEAHAEVLVITVMNQLHCSEMNDNVMYFSCNFMAREDQEEVIRQSNDQIGELPAESGMFSPESIKQLERCIKDPRKGFESRKQNYAVARSQKDMLGQAVTIGSRDRSCHKYFEIKLVPKSMLGTLVWTLKIVALGCEAGGQRAVPVPEDRSKSLPLLMPRTQGSVPMHYLERAGPEYEQVYELGEVR